MKAEDVDAVWVEKVEASLRADGAYSDDVAREWIARHALAAVLPDIWTEASDFLARSDENGLGASHVGAARLRMRARDARLTATTEEPTT